MKWPKFSIKSNIDEFGYGFKSTLAQIFALTTTYLFIMKAGIDSITPTVIIGAVTDNRNTDYNNPLSDLSEEQMSWIGSLVYLFPPVGSVAASLGQDYFGHRKCMMFSDVMNIATIGILMFANTPEFLYAISAVMGFNMGFITTFTISYCGEVCEPKLRGVLMTVINLFYFAGYLCVTTLYAITADWKLSVLLTVTIPIAAAVFLIKTPDSPMWLLSRGRTEEAKQTLKKLRGDATEESCNKEFEDMIQYTSNMNNPITGETKLVTFKDSFYSLMEPESLEPMIMLLILTFFINIMSGVPYIPYLMAVFDTFKTPIHSAWATAIYTGLSVIGNVPTIFIISRLGKRFLSMSTMAISSVCYLCIGVIGHFWTSSLISSWAQVILFFVSIFAASMGIMPILGILMCELYPMKTKNMGAGISSATYFITCFVMTKFYLNIENLIGFYNTFVLFGFFGLTGVVYMYFQLPETENKTLKEISENFKKKSPKIDVQTN
ncbi:Sugar transporter, conserved site,Major facilitator superfamily domain,Major facilitator, sugar [Cinara cedri]|uniref:Sugar transporter, conserved site,Major facilitator superfamily domain,Major facilitator, sugar n=1 Tax=Cinara cedri TaxID=506608 RepID=A0A5E4NAV6_9HEMI|nr:Sugar transporter, conserved site,Major facilitator superfamily domain,Major facilitator, sugar [Cinara cedri]